MSSDDIPIVFRTPSRVRRTELRQFLGEVVRRVTRGKSISCVITNDAELRRLNQTFRGKNAPTDVLSFPASPAANLTPAFSGNLAVSIDRAKEQAARYGHSLEDELRILILHGALHLTGMNHETDSGEMARAEARWRRRLGLPHGLIARSQRGLHRMQP